MCDLSTTFCIVGGMPKGGEQPNEGRVLYEKAKAGLLWQPQQKVWYVGVGVGVNPGRLSIAAR
jgi:hypothetical protein